MSEVIRLVDVTKEYGEGPGRVQALRGVNLVIHSGDFLALVGPSGSGKSTVLNLISGIDRPTTGQVLVDAQDTSGLTGTQMSRLRRDRIGLIFQAYNLLPVLTVYENAEYVLMLQGKPPEERKARVMQVLQQVGLDALANRFPRELSGGQQQRVAIARAMAAHPGIILADEPTANLDSKTSAALLDLMVDLNERQGITFLLSTHDPAVMRRARGVITIKDGQNQSERPPNALAPAG